MPFNHHVILNMSRKNECSVYERNGFALTVFCVKMKGIYYRYQTQFQSLFNAQACVVHRSQPLSTASYTLFYQIHEFIFLFHWWCTISCRWSTHPNTKYKNQNVSDGSSWVKWVCALKSAHCSNRTVNRTFEVHIERKVGEWMRRAHKLHMKPPPQISNDNTEEVGHRI